ncbi:MAG: hypothetical protein FJ263_08545 [Planctomycetes bacterium]|nr:hypothetical protein [Planctomycetota bacterium]
MIFLLATAEKVEHLAKLVPVVIVFVLYAFIFGLVIIVLIRLARFLGKANREQQLTRLEMGKVADEVQKMRHELQGVSSKLQPNERKDK